MDAFATSSSKSSCKILLFRCNLLSYTGPSQPDGGSVHGICRSLALFALIAATHPCLSQGKLTIQNHKPETPVLSLPYTADYDISSVQHLSDGTTITRHITGHAARSTAGVERLEGALVSNSPQANTPGTEIWILDRTQHTVVLLNAKLKTAFLTRFPPDSTVTIGFLPPSPSQAPDRAKLESVNSENLGSRVQDGFVLTGRRVTGTIPAGVVGNEEPFLNTTETWESPRLKLLVSRSEHDPRLGELDMKLTKLRAEEPDPALFQVPPDYKVIEQHPIPTPTTPAPTQPAS